MANQPRPLTLIECLNQPRGTEGRLFKAPPEVKEIPGPYRLIERRDDEIDVEYYSGLGKTTRALGLPLPKRAQDEVMSSEESIAIYVKYGMGAVAVQTLSASLHR